MAGLKPRATTLAELAERASFYVAARPLAPERQGGAAARRCRPRAARRRWRRRWPGSADWQPAALEQAVRACAEALGVKLGQLAQPLRAALTGADASPGLFEVMAVLGRDEVLGRIGDAVAANAAVQHDD